MAFSTRMMGLVLSVVIAATVAGCGDDDSAHMIYGTVTVNSITQQGSCEDVMVKAVPVELKPNSPRLANTKEFVTAVKLTKGEDGVSCTGSVQTVPMAAGSWKFTASLPSDPSTPSECQKDISEQGPKDISFKDGEKACK